MTESSLYNIYNLLKSVRLCYAEGLKVHVGGDYDEGTVFLLPGGHFGKKKIKPAYGTSQDSPHLAASLVCQSPFCLSPHCYQDLLTVVERSSRHEGHPPPRGEAQAWIMEI